MVHNFTTKVAASDDHDGPIKFAKNFKYTLAPLVVGFCIDFCLI